MLAPTSADTWGISGPAFLAGYALLAALVVGWWLATRSAARAGGPGSRPPADLAARPHDVAYLNGGAPLAIYSALGSMRLHGWVTLTAGSVHAAGRVGAGASELERAIHRTTARPLHRGALTAQLPVRAALDATEQRLTRAGLLVPAATRGRLRGIGLAMLAVAGLGMARLVAGIAGGRPVGFLVALLVAIVVAAVVLLTAGPRRTRLGDRALAELRSRQDGLAPRNRPDWTLYGPATAALGIGLFGVEALWASDPAMAAEMAAQRATTAGAGGDGGGGDGGGGGCGGGGCGGCGG